jgi:glycosyltransferase involved in cell wall biosynthesis
MAVRDGAAFLAQAVESILAQSFAEYELIVVDDRSVDATPRLLAGFAARGRRVRVLVQPRAGRIAALNRGIT